MSYFYETPGIRDHNHLETEGRERERDCNHTTTHLQILQYCREIIVITVSKGGRRSLLGKTIPYSNKVWTGPARLGNMLVRTYCKND